MMQRKGHARRRRSPVNQQKQLAASALAGAALAAALLLLFHSQLRPVLAQLAGAQVNNLVAGLVSEVIQECAASGTLDSSALITLEKDSSGQITALHSDMAAAEQLRVRVVRQLLDRMDVLSTQEIRIPLGSLTGSALLSGRGPSVPVRVLSVGAVSAGFDNRFTSAGINQTYYQVILDLRVTVDLLLPGGPAQTEVETQVVAAEAVLLGQVPERYAYFSSFDAAGAAADRGS